jgi:ankyrin repeat protein
MQEIYAAGQVDPYALEKTSRRSALHKAAFWGHILTINFLIKDVRMDVNQQDFNGDTAMHDAARFGHVNVVEALLNAGGNPAIKNKKGESVIELALKQDKFDVAQCILKSQVSKNVKNGGGGDFNMSLLLLLLVRFCRSFLVEL